MESVTLEKKEVGIGKFVIGVYEKRGDEKKLYDVIIIGSGPAGLTAGIYSVRAGLSTLIITGYTWGGQLMTTTKVDNYPGFPEGVDGPDLMMRLRQQAAKFGVEFVEADATNLDLRKRPFKVYVENRVFKGKSIIIATGAKYRELGLEAERRLLGKGVSYCAVCDGYFFKDMKVAVIGGGDTAVTDAIYLSNIADEVYLIHRRSELRATKLLQDKLKTIKNIKLILNSEVTDIIGEDRVAAIKIKNKENNIEEILEVDGVFIAIGHIPATDLVKGQIELTENGYIKTYGFTKTSVEGVFAAGDVMDPRYQQMVTAAAFGAMAAIDAEEYLRKSGQIT
jgi:thioredoxin reductase (NADPH)